MSATIEVYDWSSEAAGWAELWACLAQPARRALLALTGVGEDTAFLDIGCGTGELCQLAAWRGAQVAGVDRAEGMVQIARHRVPRADLRVGDVEHLPFADGAFGVVTAVNSLQFAGDYGAAVAEAARVLRPGGQLAICNWGPHEEQEALLVAEELMALAPPMNRPPRPAVEVAGVLEDVLRDAGLTPVAAGVVEVPYVVPDRATLERAYLLDAALMRIEAEEAAVRALIANAAQPYRREDGSYRFENRFRYAVARRLAAPAPGDERAGDREHPEGVEGAASAAGGIDGIAGPVAVAFAAASSSEHRATLPQPHRKSQPRLGEHR